MVYCSGYMESNVHLWYSTCYIYDKLDLWRPQENQVFDLPLSTCVQRCQSGLKSDGRGSRWQKILFIQAIFGMTVFFSHLLICHLQQNFVLHYAQIILFFLKSRHFGTFSSEILCIIRDDISRLADPKSGVVTPGLTPMHASTWLFDADTIDIST